ncbi:cell morphogenesis N-terminal-domain-containing protein [Vararia minispora EC-137]|uniref:Cell morphogenesis N-terminal-domain-containing protein n=1 Tax=Vararia minispora EC-137 TaxID=1314806 RepID=A0ACB8QLQ8_9AGAM|nr:cell morphogenesis N-terminal-domain-containing protein [Vararia minispora EC-137]
MSEGVQITIPDFDDEDFHSTSIPFGRTPGTTSFGFGSFGGASGFGGQESPTSSTPTGFGDRYTHSRGDSVTSEDSTTSARGQNRSKQPSFAHSSTSSFTNQPTASAPAFTKKPSFASIRNAFKSGTNKAVDLPPLPSFESSSYPVLKNPFNRSNSSLAHVPPASQRRPADGMSPPHVRSATPGSSDFRNGRQTPRHRAQASRSQHSYSGSVHHQSDGGSDHGHYYRNSPPPVPPMPDALYGVLAYHENSEMIDDDRVEPDPRTPAEYALHAVFIRFASAAEIKIDTFLRQNLDSEPALKDFMGPNIDTHFDDILQTLGRLGQKNAKSVVDSILRWRRTQDPVSNDVLRHHGNTSPVSLRGGRSQDTLYVLNERKSLAAIYIMCRALIVVMQGLSKDALGDTMGYNLEKTTFEQFRRPDVKILASANHQANAELFATLLGHLANTRFTSVTDRFLSELSPVISGQVPKDMDMRFENLVRGLKHVQIKVWPLESFEEGAEFMETLAKAFDNAHGFRFKLAFAETLVQLLHPVAKTAQAEVNYPQWAKAIEIIHPKAKELAGKPRYWHVAYALVVVSLCVSPSEYFLKHWMGCFEAGLSKLKEKPYRIPVLNGMMRLIWTYMFRCRESISASTSRMETLLRIFFPPNRLAIFPNEDHLEPFIYIVHFVFARHLDFGVEFLSNLMQESAVKSMQGNIMSILSPERLTIAVQAILLTLHLHERDEQIPVWPSSSDFSGAPSWHDYPSSSEFMSPTVLNKPGMQDFFERCGVLISHISISCANTVGNMSVFDEQWSASRLNPSFEETHNFVIRRHPDGTFAYSNTLSPQIAMLQTCFQAWPRCLHPTVPLRDTIDMLLRGVLHVEPGVGEAAVLAIRRFMDDPQYAIQVLEKFASFLLSPTAITKEGSSTKLVYENARLLNLWVSVLDGWIHKLLGQKREDVTGEEVSAISARLDEAEAGALFLLCHASRTIISVGVRLLRLIGLASAHIWPKPDGKSPSDHPIRIVDLFHGTGGESPILCDRFSHVLEPSDLERLQRWNNMGKEDVVLRIADSEDARDRMIWQWVYPDLMHRFTSAEMNHSTGTLNILRGCLIAAEMRFHSTISSMAGLSTKIPTATSTRSVGIGDGSRMPADSKTLSGQWYMWTKILCSIASILDTRVALVTRDHNRAPSEVQPERDRWTTTRGLVRYLTPFLDSELSSFRDAAVYCFSALPSKGYPILLDDMGLLLHRQLDEPRLKSGAYPGPDRTRRQERLFTAIARIFFLTAPCLQDTRFSARQAALAPVLKFVRNTQAFLTAPESRDQFKLQRMRRYFCGTVERLFDGLTTLANSDRFVPPHMQLSLYRLCEEWCQFGRQSEAVTQRLVIMQRSAMNTVASPAERGEAVTIFQKESKLLSKAAVGAMAALIAKAYYPPESSSNSPTDSSISPEYLRSLDAKTTLSRIHAFLATLDESVQASGRKALRALLANSRRDPEIAQEAMKLSFVTTKELDTSSVRFFEAVADVICSGTEHGFEFGQVVCLGLCNLSHPAFHVRSLALHMLETVHENSSGMLSISQFEAAVGSSAPSIYQNAHRLISDVLANEHPDKATSVLSEFASWLPVVHEIATTPQVLLQSLEYWMPNVVLTNEDKTTLSRQGRNALLHLIALTLRFSDSHAEQVQMFWTRLVDPPYQSNGQATVRFLLEHSQRDGSGSIPYVQCAAKIVAALSHSAIGRQVVEDLCGVIEPARMLPALDHKLKFPDPEDAEFWSDLDVLFNEQPHQQLGAGQFALLFLRDVALDRIWEFQDHLPTLLHGIFTHLDHRLLFVREASQRLLSQVLRAWIPGYDELPDRLSLPSRTALKEAILKLEQEIQTQLWHENDTPTQSEAKMQSICSQVVQILEPLYKNLRQQWGSLAVLWGTSCSIRGIAYRSLQLFRALMHVSTQNDMAMLLGRLSNTVAAVDEGVQLFSAELLQTLTALTDCPGADASLLPQIFWCACACLSTTVETEFLKVVTLLQTVIARLDLDNPSTIQTVLSQSPLDWVGPTSLQGALLVGLRSSNTSDSTFKMLQCLSKFSDSRLIEPTVGRIRDLYTIALPWCLNAMAEDKIEEALIAFVEDVAILAEQEDKPNLGRILTSFVKGRFRTKDDFLRQSVAGLREHYGGDDWTAVIYTLLSLVLNQQSWLRLSSLQILKVLFQQRDTRHPIEVMGSELLMPLLRLLETDLAPQALEVLEEPITVSSGGLPAKQVLRMSMVMKPLRKDREAESIGKFFGVPESSGWCVAQPEQRREMCRANVMAVFDTCKVPSRPSQIDFEPEDVLHLAEPDPLEDDLGNLVQNLHELSTFFQDDYTGKLPSTVPPMPSQQLASRVAAILAKSTEQGTEVPQTPFLDAFRIDGLEPYHKDDSDDDSDASSDSDAFMFDSPTIVRSMRVVNGNHYL